jgi:hypothetical protein
MSGPQELTDRLEGMKVAHLAERSSYEGQLAELRGEYTKTKEELDGEIMVGIGHFCMLITCPCLGAHQET